MKKKLFAGFMMSCLIVLGCAAPALAQKRRAPAKPPARPQPIVFAVLNDGQTIEPIGTVDKGALAAATGGDSEAKDLNRFVRSYYQPKTAYRLVFGAADAGTVTVKSSGEKTDCAKNMAQIAVQSTRAKLKGFVMALATSAPVDRAASGTRRLPTAAERSEIETLVRAEFTKQGVAAKNLNYHNLTALDIDNDKRAELVGSFWVETAPTARALLFFIAEKDANGKYVFGASDLRTVKQDELMSGSEIKNIDEGVYHELLLDALEYNGDATAEIFTRTQSFEGAGFNVYSKVDGKWEKAFETANYHCAF